MTTPENATNIAGYQWYLLEKSTDDYKTLTPVSTEASYTVLPTDKDKYLQVVVKDTAGTEFASAVSSPIINADQSTDVKITDANGLQTDGTALATDTLNLTFGAGLGTPDTIAWYCNGALKAIETAKGGITGASFTQVPAVAAGSATLAKGEWYVLIRNADGEEFKSNSIVVAVSDVAVLSDVAASNDYDTANMGGLSVLPNDAKAVVSVTMNKAYTGTLYIYKDTETKYNSTVGAAAGNAVAKLVFNEDDIVTANPGGAADKVKVVPYTSKKKMTAQNALAAQTGEANCNYGSFISYTDEETGAITIMWAPEDGAGTGVALTRGTKYKVAFDQEGYEDDDITGTSREDVTTYGFTAPYLEAPASVTVSNFKQGGTTLDLTFVGEDGEKLDWMYLATGGTAVNGLGLASVKVYNIAGNEAADTDATTANTDVAVSKGVMTVTNAGMAQPYVYAKIATTAGVFAEKSATITTKVTEAALNPATAIQLEESSDVATTAVVKFTALKSAASGKVYIFHAKASGDGTYAAMKDYELEDAIASADVTGGSTKVEIEDVFSNDHLNVTGGNTDNNDFIACFVPDDTSLWNTIYGGTGGTLLAPAVFTLQNNTASYAIGGSAKGQAAVDGACAGTDTATAATLITKNQFGEEKITTAVAFANIITLDLVGATSGSKDATVKAYWDANTAAGDGLSVIYAGVTTKANINKGDKYYTKLADKNFLVFTATANGAVTFDISISETAPQ